VTYPDPDRELPSRVPEGGMYTRADQEHTSMRGRFCVTCVILILKKLPNILHKMAQFRHNSPTILTIGRFFSGMRSVRDAGSIRPSLQES